VPDRYVLLRYDSETQIENFLYLFPRRMVPCGAIDAAEVELPAEAPSAWSNPLEP